MSELHETCRCLEPLGKTCLEPVRDAVKCRDCPYNPDMIKREFWLDITLNFLKITLFLTMFFCIGLMFYVIIGTLVNDVRTHLIIACSFGMGYFATITITGILFYKYKLGGFR